MWRAAGHRSKLSPSAIGIPHAPGAVRPQVLRAVGHNHEELQFDPDLCVAPADLTARFIAIAKVRHTAWRCSRPGAHSVCEQHYTLQQACLPALPTRGMRVCIASACSYICSCIQPRTW